MMYLLLCLLQNRTVPLPPKAQESDLKQTWVRTGIGSELSIRNPFREMSTQLPMAYLSKVLVHAKRMADEHG